MKKLLIICGVLLILFFAFCFKIGYKLPQRDLHKDWPLLGENNNPNYMIEPTIGLNAVVSLSSSKLLMLINFAQMVVVDSNGTVLRKFEDIDALYIDSYHSRLITQKAVRINEMSNSTYYLSYDLKDFREQCVDLIDYTLAESFDDFVRSKGQTLDYAGDATKQDSVRERLLARQYKAAQIKDAVFFSTLHHVQRLRDYNGGIERTNYFTDPNGKLFDIRPPQDSSYTDFHGSMKILYPDFSEAPDIQLHEGHSPNFHIADQPTIAGNDFEFYSGISMMSPTGGNSSPMQLYFEQNYLHYYAVNIKDSTVHFKILDRVHILYVKDKVTSFLQLNTPKSDKDTLAFISGGKLYKVYQRSQTMHHK